jgi:uncharacterized CHY-type Zn-finger protein
MQVHGRPIDDQTRCVHYHSELDVVAIKFKCCGELYLCHLCHEELAGHVAEQWSLDEYDEPAILCGVCGTMLTIAEYLGSGDHCPHCAAAFNPGCRLHTQFYFETAGDACEADGGSVK